jgi:hypothetical protein
MMPSKNPAKTFTVNKATAMFAETIENLLTFDAGFT